MVESDSSTLVVCHECDILQQVKQLPPGAVARCVCCGARLYGNPKGGLDVPLALVISTLVVYVVANAYPLMTLKIAGLSQGTTLSGASWALYRAGMWELGLVVLLVSVVFPGLIIGSTLYVLLALRFSLRLPRVRQVLAWISRLSPWGMLDVFMLGILVSLVKLSGMADVVIGTGLYAFTALIFLFAASAARLELHLLWQRVGMPS
jgi:paraquat-inducible protein A